MSKNQNGNTSPGKDPEARTQGTPQEGASPEDLLRAGGIAGGITGSITGGSDCI